MGGNSSDLIRGYDLSSALCLNQFDESWINTVSINMKTVDLYEYHAGVAVRLEVYLDLTCKCLYSSNSVSKLESNLN